VKKYHKVWSQNMLHYTLMFNINVYYLYLHAFLHLTLIYQQLFQYWGTWFPQSNLSKFSCSYISQLPPIFQLFSSYSDCCGPNCVQTEPLASDSHHAASTTALSHCTYHPNEDIFLKIITPLRAFWLYTLNTDILATLKFVTTRNVLLRHIGKWWALIIYFKPLLF
jgi:hypothetical protein